MSKMIRIRNAPDERHRTLRVRAAQTALSLSDDLPEPLRSVAERPTREEPIERVSRRAPLRTRVGAAAAVRTERARR